MPTLQKSTHSKELVFNNGFTPIVGRKASILIEDDGAYYDCVIKQFIRGNRFAKVFVEELDREYITPIGLLEKPLSSDVNERFEYFRDLTTMVIRGKLKSLFVSGEGGIGKSHTLNEVLELNNFVEKGDGQLGEDGIEKFDYIRIKGYTTARAMFDYLRENNDKLFIFEDCDSALTDPTAQNILKAILDTYDRRRVSWFSKNENASFEFHGSVIFLSNKNKTDISQAIISRSAIIDLFMSEEEKIERMEFLLPTINVAKTLTDEERLDVLRLIDRYKYTISDLNLRTLIKALIVYEESKNLDLTRYQILNG